MWGTGEDLRWETVAYQPLEKGFPVLRWYITILAETKRNNTATSHGKTPRSNAPLPSLLRFIQENVQTSSHTVCDDSPSSWVCSFTASHIHPFAHLMNIYRQVSVGSSVESRGTDMSNLRKDGAKLCGESAVQGRRTCTHMCRAAGKLSLGWKWWRKMWALHLPWGKGSGRTLSLEFYSVRWPCPVWADLLIVPWFCFLK